MNTDTITEIAIAELSESPFNPRKTFHDAALQSLTDDIISQGRVLQPLLVRPIVPPLFRDGHGDSTDLNAVAGYEIVFGHRRYRAASMAGLTHVPCMVRPMLDDEARRAQISENLARIPKLKLLGIAETESEALAMLHAQPCDVLILDIQLRQGNGINLLRVLSGDPTYARTIKIVLSNHVSGTYRRICEQYGVQFFFDKTSEFPQLQRLLSRFSENGID